MNLAQKISFAALAFASTLAFSQSIDTKSKTILDAVTKHYNSKKNSYFKFIFGSGANGRISKTQTGIFYSAGQKYKLKIMGTEQIFDGNKIYNISDDDQEVTIAKPNSGDVMFSPLNYLNSYRKDYNVSYSGTSTVNGVFTDVIKLTPVKQNGINTVTLYVNSAKNQLVKLEQTGTNKDLSTITITDYRENQSLSPSMFVYDKAKYKNYVQTEL